MTFTTKNNIAINCSECDSLLVVESIKIGESSDTLYIKVQPCIVCSNREIDDSTDLYDELDDILSDTINSYLEKRR